MTLLLVFAVVQAALGFHLSEADRRRLGRTPWGLPSMVWALFWFLSLLLGVVLYLVAHRAEVRRVAQAGVGPFTGVATMSAANEPPRSVGSDFPAYPRPADGGTTRSPEPPPAAPAPVDAAPPSWQADPSGRFHYRWWTGTEWTSYVSTHGQVVVDSSPDQRIGPY
jgi:hypothetical protein